MSSSLPFRAIMSDLDGTLLNQQHKIGEFTQTTLQKVAALGVDIFIATGRNLPDVQHLVSKLNLPNVTLVTSNGARANHLAGDCFVNHYLPEQIAVDLLTNIPFDPQNVCVNSYQGDDWFINVDVPALKAFHNESGFCYQVVDFKQHHGKQAEKIFFIGRSPDVLKPIEQAIRQKYADQIQITYSTPQCLEVMAKGVCKANTLANLVAERGYSLNECIAFGDGMNDLEMLSRAGKGCVMGNADPRLKQALPNHEVIGEHQQQAVAHYLAKVFDLG